jgi:hypothetical protein
MNHHVMHVYSVCFSWPSGPKSHPQATTSRHVQHKWKDWKPSSPCPSACAGQPLEPGSWSAAVPRQFESSASELEDWPPAKAGQSQPICKWVRLYTVVNPFIFCCLWLLYIYMYIYYIYLRVCIKFKYMSPFSQTKTEAWWRDSHFLNICPRHWSHAQTVRAKELLARSTNTEAGLAERNLDSAACCKRDWRSLSWCQLGLEMGLDMSFLFQSSHYSGNWSVCKVRVSNFVNLSCAVCGWWRLNLQFAVVDCAWQLDKHINRYYWLGLGSCRLDKHLNWQSSRWQGFLVACFWFWWGWDVLKGWVHRFRS